MKLFSVPLEGKGTAEVESFASYVHRLAYEHGVFVGELMRHVIRNQPIYCRATVFYRKPQELVRPSATTQALVEVIEAATSISDLTRGILWCFEIPLALSGEEVCDGFRWCTLCFSEMSEFGIPAYFKLMWHMSALVECPTHKCLLMEACHVCGEGQETYRKNYPLDHCQHCGSSLWRGVVPVTGESRFTSHVLEAHDVIELLHDLALYPLYGLPEKGPVLSLEKIFDHYWKSDNEGHLYALIPRDLLLGAIHSEEKMSLRTARRFSHLLGIPLIALLSGEANSCPGVLSAEWVCELPPSYMHKRNRNNHNHIKVLKALNRLLRSNKTPPSLPELARQLNVSVGYLEYRYASIVSKLRLTRRNALAEEREKTVLFARRSAVSFFANEFQGRNLISRKEAYRQLRAETGLPKWVLKNAIQDAYEALYG
ncbi:TniQ family protein [Halopseudomonas bauzanensis]|uniref:TniQ family protein n=1 Tax=Halopseudomonas bauzanensis TaxID=653930 RepID=UPI0025567F66|nr:TniQ family protein [Halopseudomonas bauzanensis]